MRLNNVYYCVHFNAYNLLILKVFYVLMYLNNTQISCFNPPHIKKNIFSGHDLGSIHERRGQPF